MKNKGFTLVELLVAIVILGIITGLSIPLLRVISNNRTEKQYKTYMDSMIASAKLYNDSYYTPPKGTPPNLGGESCAQGKITPKETISSDEKTE